MFWFDLLYVVCVVVVRWVGKGWCVDGQFCQFVMQGVQVCFVEVGVNVFCIVQFVCVIIDVEQECVEVVVVVFGCVVVVDYEFLLLFVFEFDLCWVVVGVVWCICVFVDYIFE